jgi:hypothetical protein
MYGEGSFLQDYMKGEASYEACSVAITNWELSARILERTPEEAEMPKEAKIRRKNVTTYRSAVETLKRL